MLGRVLFQNSKSAPYSWCKLHCVGTARVGSEIVVLTNLFVADVAVKFAHEIGQFPAEVDIERSSGEFDVRD